ncbi:nucleotidyltransferase domain-containing protein [Microbulbifer harenosus]|uniref:nucleotidyltransferase domain-containing protein n=1 Tax=Microbulbifer harenosus TaxID=2576840 RepID=UPI003BA19B9B
MERSLLAILPLKGERGAAQPSVPLKVSLGIASALKISGCVSLVASKVINTNKAGQPGSGPSALRGTAYLVHVLRGSLRSHFRAKRAQGKLPLPAALGSKKADMRYDTYSLKKILTDLTNTFTGVTEVYLFGSRLHRTMSTRSDVDLLISVDKSVLAEDIRDFAIAECKALDFFLIDRGVATSCANGSKVRARTRSH